MDRLIRGLLVLFFLGCGPVLAQETLPNGKILPNGDMNFGTYRLGTLSAGKLTLKPDAIQIMGLGSTGDASGMTNLGRGLATRAQDSLVVLDAPYFAQGNNVADDTTALQNGINAAAASKKTLVIPAPSSCYRLTGFLAVPSNSRIDARGAKFCLASGVNTAMIRLATGADNVLISGGEFDGNKANNPSGGPCVQTPNGGSNITIEGVYAHDCPVDGIRAGGTLVTNYEVRSSRAENNGAAGITIDANVRGFRLIGNYATGNATHGVGIIGIAQFGVIANNVSENNDPSTLYADNFTGYNTGNTDIVLVGNVSRGSGNHGFHFGGNRITYTGNSAFGANRNCFFHKNDTGASDGIVFTGNTAGGCGLSGFVLENVGSGTVTGNYSSGNTQRGFYSANTSNVTFGENVSKGNTLDGMRSDTSGTNIQYINNISTGNGLSGLKFAGLTTARAVDNILTGNTQYGYQSGSGNAAGGITLERNDLRTNTLGPFDYVTYAEFFLLQNNRGYTRPGSGTITVTASPMTYTAGASPETLSVRGGTVTNISLNGQTLYDTSNIVIPLSANDNLTLTYTTAPTLVRVVK